MPVNINDFHPDSDLLPFPPKAPTLSQLTLQQPLSQTSKPSSTTIAKDRLRSITTHLNPNCVSPYPPSLFPPLQPAIQSQRRHLSYTSHLSRYNPSSSLSTMPEPITCHVLDTYSGRPGSSIPVTLRLISTSSAAAGSTAIPPIGPVVFTALTNADGRIAGWAPHVSTAGLPSLFAAFAQTPAGTKMTWEIVFELEAFWAAKPVDAFFPRATITFLTNGFGNAADEGQPHPEHWHVPLLVSPFSYTTYRGS